MVPEFDGKSILGLSAPGVPDRDPALFGCLLVRLTELTEPS
jgi:hypothetical protein